MLISWENLFSQDIYATTVDQSVKRILGNTVNLSFHSFRFSENEVSKIKASSKIKSIRDSINLYICRIDTDIVAYAFLDDVKGKSLPITYLVLLDKNGTILDVDIVKYRETHGYEISNESFRKQFHGKSQDETPRFRKNIRNISGATISSRSITEGVGKILNIFSTIKGSLPQ